MNEENQDQSLIPETPSPSAQTDDQIALQATRDWFGVTLDEARNSNYCPFQNIILAALQAKAVREEKEQAVIRSLHCVHGRVMDICDMCNGVSGLTEPSADNVEAVLQKVCELLVQWTERRDAITISGLTTADYRNGLRDATGDCQTDLEIILSAHSNASGAPPISQSPSSLPPKEFDAEDAANLARVAHVPDSHLRVELATCNAELEAGHAIIDAHYGLSKDEQMSLDMLSDRLKRLLPSLPPQSQGSERGGKTLSDFTSIGWAIKRLETVAFRIRQTLMGKDWTRREADAAIIEEEVIPILTKHVRLPSVGRGPDNYLAAQFIPNHGLHECEWLECHWHSNPPLSKEVPVGAPKVKETRKEGDATCNAQFTVGRTYQKDAPNVLEETHLSNAAPVVQPDSDAADRKNFLTIKQCADQFRLYAKSHPNKEAVHQLNFCADFLEEFCVVAPSPLQTQWRWTYVPTDPLGAWRILEGDREIAVVPFVQERVPKAICDAHNASLKDDPCREALQELHDNAVIEQNDDHLICFDRKTFVEKLAAILEPSPVPAASEVEEEKTKLE